MKFYIAGPMRGKPLFNFPAFDEAKQDLQEFGHEVVSPADLDREQGFDPESLPGTYAPENWNENLLPTGWSLERLMARDLKALETCQAIYLLEGWENSTGARREHEFALKHNLLVFIQGSALPKAEEDTILDEAKALVTGDRNASYGPPNQDFQRTADMWTGLMQHRLKDGERFRPQDVAWMMMLLKASRAQHSEKKDNYIDAAGYAYCGWRCEQEGNRVQNREP
jgi:hypothetical protein